ncbi:prolyl oligopeptidase family serine peptidase [candidate division KSB1 bacterium]
MNNMRYYFWVVAMCLFSVSGVIAQVPYSQAQQYRSTVGNPLIAPDGESFYVSINAYVDGRGRTGSAVMHFDMNGRELESDFQRMPSNLSPDGKWIVSMGNYQGKRSLMLYDVSTDEERFLANVPVSDHFLGHTTDKNFVWSPDSRFIAYAAAEREWEEPESDVKVYSRILYKTRTSFTDNINTHIFIVPVAGGRPRQLTTGPYDEHSLSWHPDGTKIAFISNRTDDPDDNHNNDLWTVDISSGRVTQVTNTAGAEFDPLYSPDGQYLAYLAGVRPINTKDSQAENPHLFVMPSAGGNPVDAGKQLDRRIRTVQWSPDNRYLYFTADNHGGRLLYRVKNSGGEVEKLVDGDVRVGSFAVSLKRDRIVYSQSSHVDPGELWSATLDGKNHRGLTHYQDAFKENVALSVPETIWFESFDGTMVQGWIVAPADVRQGYKYPLIMTIHGGPHGAYGYSISGSNQQYAEAGFGILYINPRGSVGYGQKFADGTINNWGGGDYQDLMAGVDYAIAHYDWIDADRLGVMGGSYGGYMTNWVITQTDRFKAAVSRASVSNLISFYGNSLYQLLIETEFPGELWDNYDLLWHWSPMKHVKNVKTPTLFIHGENDHDVPITQAEEMFIALLKLGVETTFARYPGEGHGIRRPDHQRDSSERTMDWFVTYLEPGTLVRK